MAALASLSSPATPDVTRQHVGQALRSLRLNYRHDSRRLNAVNRAALNLEACAWYRQPDGLLVIESATATGTVRYHVDGPHCDCQAGQHGTPCWHAQANELLHDAEAIASTPTRPRMSDAQYAAVVAAADELFN
jgi:hypothetical protein